MIAYFKCLCKAQDKILANKLKQQGFEVRVINSNPVYRQEAKLYKTKLPFKVENGKVTQL